MSGDGLIPPLNAPAGGVLTPGVQPGVAGQIVLAHYVIVFGTSGGVFLYNGTPAPGNPPVASVTLASTDPYGNTVQPGFTIYDLPAYLEMHVNSGFTAPAIEMVTGVTSEADHAALYTAPGNTGLVNEAIATWLIGAGSTHDGIQATVELLSAAADGSAAAAGVLGLIKSGIFTGHAFWDVTGFQAIGPGGGNGWYVNGTQTDASTNTNANQAAATPISVAWTIPANDANAGTIYELEVPWDGVTVAGDALHLGLSIDGSSTNIVETSVIPGGVSPNGIVKAILQVLTTGPGGTVNAFIGGTLSPNASNATPSNSMGYAGTKRAKGVTLDTTASHTLTMNSLWPSSSATQTVSGYGSAFTRKGQ
jgi:hypothetical protein